MNRRDFLKAAPATAGAFAVIARTGELQPPSDTRISATANTPVDDYPIQPKRLSDVRITDRFWGPRIDTNAAVTIPFEVQKLTESRRGLSGNVLEAAILSLATHPDAELQARVDARIRDMASAPFAGNGDFEVAATYYQVTGKRDLLDRAIAAAEALYRDFVVNDPPFSGGERDAINCVQLYRATHDRKHLDLAQHYLDIRGLESSVNRSRHNQSYKPVVEQSEAVGHAVNCVSLMVSLADVGVLTGIRSYLDAAQRMWRDAVERKMYVTGGVGSTGNEGFGEPYSLPTISAYAETCAVLMFITLNHRLFMATGDGKYVDVMERGMYNNAIDGVSAAGNRFFYVNRLASAGDGRDTRWERASLECCPPNLVRFLAAMPGFVYAQDRRGAVYVNLYVSSEASFDVDGRRLALSVESEMPWDGRSRLVVSTDGNPRAAIKLRIPGWARNQPVPGNLYTYADRVERQATVSVNGMQVSAVPDAAGYVSLDRTWKNGDVVVVNLPVEARRVVADPRVKESRGRMTIERGPIVYCAEWPDVPSGKALDLLFDPDVAVKPSVVGDAGPAGGFIFYENPNHAADGWRYLEAAPFDQSAGARWGCFRRAIAGARGTAIGTGRQNTRDMLAGCAEPGTAAQLCATLVVNGVGGWFLPSRDELALMYRNLKAAGAGDSQDAGVRDNFTYWASSQQTADMAVHIDFADLGRQHGDDKDFPRRVRAIRAI